MKNVTVAQVIDYLKQFESDVLVFETYDDVIDKDCKHITLDSMIEELQYLIREIK